MVEALQVAINGDEPHPAALYMWGTLHRPGSEEAERLAEIGVREACGETFVTSVYRRRASSPVAPRIY